MARGLAELRPVQARIDLARLRDNYRAVAAFAKLPVMPVVKADAYGHGAATVARFLETCGAGRLAVAYPEEGALLRHAGIQSPILVLAGFTAEQVPLLARHALSPVVATPAQLDAILGAHTGSLFAVHLKLDSGMARLGFDVEMLLRAAALLQREPHIRIAGLMTHLAAADEDHAFTEKQLDRFDAAIEALARDGVRPSLIHAANSAGLAQLRPSHTLVRPGLLLYGVKPRPLAPPIEVRPVMTVSARVSLVKDVAAGTPISYGGRFVTARPSRIATLPIGYADGVPRTKAMSETGAFALGAGRAPVAGTVCMDLTMLDVTDLGGVAVGDEAVLFGDSPTAWDVAERAGTTAWQALTAIGSRVPRVYLDGGTSGGTESRYLLHE